MRLFILTGSQQFGLLSGISQSLAGRTAFIELLPFSFSELIRVDRLPGQADSLLYTGCYPPLYDRDIAPRAWFSVYVTAYIERDVRQILKKIYFYDVGLVSWLLEIQTPEQLETHPLRGNIFETCIIAELMKSRLNKGERPNLFFWHLDFFVFLEKRLATFQIAKVLDQGIDILIVKIPFNML